jgi:hypothetical protein
MEKLFLRAKLLILVLALTLIVCVAVFRDLIGKK